MIRCLRIDWAFASGMEGDGQESCRWRALESCDSRTAGASEAGAADACEGGERSAESNSREKAADVLESGEDPDRSESE